ncbi:kynureninase [Alteromonas sp. ASW11-36]|uniref:Kynureninase n=1 Tax=Alteromonas arenosi TaxID=3055817 RepID=A0ABT7SY06_9ALTE|nr:kynureninase [Alteromonas sp. ASW11-36]MDM7861068.1 kynureninase [Alteromonas sp. ASW11-36]
MNNVFATAFEQANQRDDADQLSHFKQRFDLPEDMVYLDGNSLGPLTIAAKERAYTVVEQQWGKDLITSWNRHDWINLPIITGEKIAPLIGAAAGQVICCDSISVNLFKLLSAALNMRPDRHAVLTTMDNFPTDRYVAEGLNQLNRAHPIELRSTSEANIYEAINEDIAVVMLTQVNFRTGNRLDVKTITQRAHDKGCLIIWDLAHSAGVIPVELDDNQVDFAVGCGYKYLNGGPGAPAFVYVAQRHQEQYRQPLQGWMGHTQPFSFDPRYQPAASIKSNLVGTPSVISMSVMDAALDIFADVEISALETKALALTQWFHTLLERAEMNKVFSVSEYFDARHSGAQLALRHENAYAICQAWIASGVIADFRAPDILRVGFSPLFLSFSDLVSAVEKLSAIMEAAEYLQPQFNEVHTVT